jgi:integrase
MRSTGKEITSGSNIMNSNEYMLQLHKRLLEKTYGTPPRNVGETTASAYIKTLYNLNDKKTFKNLAFLKKTEEIMKKIGEYADSTQKTLISTIASVLSLDKDKTGYKTVYKFYYDKMMEKAKVAKETDTSEKTDKQEKNWIGWEEVQKKYADMTTDIAKQKKPTAEHLLPLVVLGLYVEIPPRRNQDYLQMVVVKTNKKTKIYEFPKDKNYLTLNKGKPEAFIFNKYKTSKTYGTQTITIPPTLSEIIKKYLKVHSSVLKDKTTTSFPFLVSGGEEITADNSITRILNKIFGKNVGSSMLRHIYLSSKYDINSMKSDADQMGHSISQQKEYLKGSETPTVPSTVDDTIQT